VCGLGDFFFRAYYPDKPFADNLKDIYKARNHLLGLHGTITPILEKQFPKSKPGLSSERRTTHFFGDSIADIAVLALATELCPSEHKVLFFETTTLAWNLLYLFLWGLFSVSSVPSCVPLCLKKHVFI